MTTLSSASAPVRLDAITGLRWWAALGVFGFHVINVVQLPGPLSAAVKPGYYGVTFFFVLSGFVLTWSMRAGVNKRTFYWRRFARIYPLHFVALLFAIPVFYSFNPDPAQWWVKPFSLGILLLSVIVMQGWSRDPTVLFSGNPAAWTLTAEAFFYATHPFIASLLTKVKRRGALWGATGVLSFALVCRVLIIAFPGSWLGDLPWPVLRLNEFVLGMCLAWAMRHGWRLTLHPLTTLAVATAYFAGIAMVPALAPAGHFVPEIATILSAALIVGAANRELDGRAKWMTKRPLVALGEWSFAFYLVHATFIYIVRANWGIIPAGLPSLAVLLGLLAISITASWILHVYLERPVEARLRTWQAKREARRVSNLEARRLADLEANRPAVSVDSCAS